MLANVIHHAANPDRGQRWTGELRLRLAIALVVLSAHAAALIGLHEVDLAKASDAFVAIAQPWVCQAGLDRGRNPAGYDGHVR